jgi:hypothetical protein
MKQVDNFNPGSWLVENKLTSQSKLNENQNTLSFNGKEVDINSLQVEDINDYPDFANAYIDYAEYTDGTKLSDKEINEFNEQFPDLAAEIALENY